MTKEQQESEVSSDTPMSAESLREWLDSWGDGPNWTDSTGITVPVAKASLRAVLDELQHMRLVALPTGDFSSHAAQLRAKVQSQAREVASLRSELERVKAELQRSRASADAEVVGLNGELVRVKIFEGQ